MGLSRCQFVGRLLEHFRPTSRCPVYPTLGKEKSSSNMTPHVKCNWYSMIDLMQTTSTCVSPTTKVWKGAVANHPRVQGSKKKIKERKIHDESQNHDLKPRSQNACLSHANPWVILYFRMNISNKTLANLMSCRVIHPCLNSIMQKTSRSHTRIQVFSNPK